MRGDPSTMRVLRPETVDAALRLYARQPGAVPLAGGTDFMVGWNLGESNDRTILDLGAMNAWRRIREAASELRIGALTTHWQIQRDPRVSKRFPLLVSACATIGGRQIQSRGTLGGNIANASPAGDTFPPLAVYGARVQVRSESESRVLPLDEIFSGVKETTLRDGELITAIALPLLRRPARAMFKKVGTRQASAISKTVAAGLLWLTRKGAVRELRFALGSVAPTVRRLSTVEAFIAGRRPTGKVIDEAVSLLEQDISPIDDLRSTRAYRLRVSQNLLRSFLQSAR